MNNLIEPNEKNKKVVEIPIGNNIILWLSGKIYLTDIMNENPEIINDVKNGIKNINKDELKQYENLSNNKFIVLNGQNKTKEIIIFLNKVVYPNQYSNNFWKNVLKGCNEIKIKIR